MIQTDAGLLDDFEEHRPEPSDGLVVDVEGFEGPLDLLLQLGRDQKVDLLRISVLALSEQYLAFIERVRHLRLEIAADYLVMAAWLAYLKSRLLLPQPASEDEPSGEELAAALAARLLRLDAMRDAGRRLMTLPRLSVDVFARGMPEPIAIHATAVHQATLFDLLSAYAALRLHRMAAQVRLPRRQVFTLQEARERLMGLIGQSAEWASLDAFLTEYLDDPELRRTARASALSASLELVREGSVEMRQSAPFAPLLLRRRDGGAAALRVAASA